MKNNAQHTGVFHCKLIRNNKIIDEWSSQNTATDQGLAYLQRTAFAQGPTTVAPKPNWYIGIYSGSVSTAALAGTDAINIGSDTSEIADTQYNETARQQWIPNDATGTNSSDTTITNSSSPATFTMNGTQIVRGAFLCSKQAQSGAIATDIAFSLSNFSSSRTTEAGDILQITYESTLSN